MAFHSDKLKNIQFSSTNCVYPSTNKAIYHTVTQIRWFLQQQLSVSIRMYHGRVSLVQFRRMRTRIHVNSFLQPSGATGWPSSVCAYPIFSRWKTCQKVIGTRCGSHVKAYGDYQGFNDSERTPWRKISMRCGDWSSSSPRRERCCRTVMMVYGLKLLGFIAGIGELMSFSFNWGRVIMIAEFRVSWQTAAVITNYVIITRNCNVNWLSNVERLKIWRILNY